MAPPCDCPTGCCDAQNTCQPGGSNTLCGGGNVGCEDCTSFGLVCQGQACVTATEGGPCNQQSCSGCCDSLGVCQQGVTGTVCGGSGTACQNCLQQNEFCVNQTCAGLDGGPVCNSNTCLNGCCDTLGQCQQLSNTTCGNTQSVACVDCTATHGFCGAGGLCYGGYEPCAQTCAGCCDDNGQCFTGFEDARCGASGRACQDCTALTPASTCDLDISQPACTSQQTQCPAPYPSCPAILEQAVYPAQHVCSAADLAGAAAACSGGARTGPCNTFFATEQGVSPACATCLTPFDVEFIEQTGTRLCAVPYLDANCNHNSSCISDCVTQTCYGCVDWPTTDACSGEAIGGACATYMLADACVVQALNGAASVCNPATYSFDFGAWLAGVGALYCGQ